MKTRSAAASNVKEMKKPGNPRALGRKKKALDLDAAIDLWIWVLGLPRQNQLYPGHIPGTLI